MRVRADSPGSFEALVDVLARGGVAIAPGDTMYGLLGIAPDTDAEIRGIKGREENKPFLLLLGSAAWVSRLSDFAMPPQLSRHWPGPLTIVVPARRGGTVAVRVPDSPFLQRLLAAVGKPLFSTSVNAAGERPLESVEEMDRQFGSRVGLIYDAGDTPAGAPSTIVDATARPFRVLRQGALVVPPEDLR